MIRKPLLIFFWSVAVGLFVLLGAANLHWGDLNQDEGWYLYAARQVRHGAVPYRDFAFTQGPALPYVYALAQPWVDRWGIAGGRLFSMMLALLSALAAAWAGGRAAPRGWGRSVALLAFILAAVNVYQSYFTTVVKTYALSALFLSAGVLALGFARARAGAAAAALAGALLAFAAGTRLSAGAALPVAGLYLLIQRRRLGDARWLAFGAGGVAGLAVVWLPFLLAAPAGFLFGVFEYHSARAVGGLIPALVYKAGFISRFVQAYFVPVGLAAGLAAWWWIRPSRVPESAPPGAAPPRFSTALWVIGLGVTIVHFAAPFPYEDYQVMVMPVLAAALAASAGSLLARLGDEAAAAKWMLWLTVVALLVSTAASFSSPINQDWVIQGRDRIWWRLREDTPLQKLRDVAVWMGEQVGPNDVLLTQDTYLAVEMGCPVPPGMEMGPFSYFPDMPRERAEVLHVLNREMMLELLRATDAPLAAFSGYGLAIRAPEVSELSDEEQVALWAAVAARYEDLCEVPDFGQGGTTLRILRLGGGREAAP